MRRYQWIIVGVIVILIAAGLVLQRSMADGTENEAAAEQPPTTDRTDRDLKAARNHLVDRLIERGYLETKPVIKAMRNTKRHLFIPSSLADQAYFDHPLPIGHDQTISAPGIVAMMTELIEPGEKKKILEIGTGSGYQAAILARLCNHVYTIEIIPELGKTAKKRLDKLGYDNVSVRIGDGYKGWPKHAPFDGIMVTCAPTKVPQPLIDQLKEGGRMVIPVGERGNQHLYVMHKKDGKLQRKHILPVAFVPMTGKIQQKD